ncbi:hypothetical protein EMQ25_03280 [Arsenicitalea aurantiaca]|uniref:SH3b domain-containing protein n=1 Tax=Arsenicitalea aurantiaca TaxID=1783274 RepID=A0A433XLN5_9HYPH|nr:SH3 domain-containing protein [Arsenicitalea aurantiaca]RUT34990.1 hypothetical protein EMQ25_03280 [Arsenicitalea aurantiaca]
MNRRTRKLVLNIATGVAIAATAAVVFTPASASAQSGGATATAPVNVRSGPGTGFGIVDSLRRGERVDIDRCQGSWCYIYQDGPSGWVSADYLSRSGSPGQLLGPVAGPDAGVGISVGPGGVSIGIGTGRPGPGRPPVVVEPPRYVGEVCFYDERRFRGSEFCVEEGESLARLPRDWDDVIRSIDNPDGLQVQVCTRAGFRDCRTYTSSASNLGAFEDDISSIRVRF